MTYTGLELFMENLKQLIYSDDNPIINNHQEILLKRPQIQLLYDELCFLIELLFVEKDNNLNELEGVRYLKIRFKDAVREAHSIVGRFVYFINAKHNIPPSRYDFIKCSLDLENVMRSIDSINHEFITILDNLKAQPSAAAGDSWITYPLETKKHLNGMTVEQLETNRDAELIRDQLVQDKKQLDVVSIVGMGGSGKTTVASIVFNDPFIVYHFQVRAWVTVSQAYERRDVLIQILASISIEFDPVSASDYRLREMLHKRLMGKRYLIVVDDIWSVDAWNDLKLLLPDHNTGSRIMLTTRVNEVASHAISYGFVHQLPSLTKEESWMLLCKKVFHGHECPQWLIKPGMQIAKNCHGLPLAVVVIAGVLAKEAPTKSSWERIAKSVSSYIVTDQHGYMDILALSYDHLPLHLKDRFLYLSGFPEDHKFHVQSLIWLWMAEGFIQESGNQSLEEIAEAYLKELIDRNLLVVADRKLNGDIKSFLVHDLLRELCLNKATEEDFCLKMQSPASSSSITRPRRMFTDVDFLVNNVIDWPNPRIQSLLCFHSGRSKINITNEYFHSYPLLMVLDLHKCRLKDFPQAIELLVHLRYLAFWHTEGFPSSICNLWSLQTLIIRCSMPLSLPKTISNLVNLRHLRSDETIYFNATEKPMNLQTISKVTLVDGAESWVKYIPGIKKLASMTLADQDHDFKSLMSLETLALITIGIVSVSDQSKYPCVGFRKIHFGFPASLKKLSLTGCCFPWSDMSIIQSLPKLEVLKLLDTAFVGPRWETGEEQFRQLKFLKLKDLDIQQWEASKINFPYLKRVIIESCKDLEEIPLEIGNIPTLELIEVYEASSSAIESLHRIQEEQDDVGNYDLKINVIE